VRAVAVERLTSPVCRLLLAVVAVQESLLVAIQSMHVIFFCCIAVVVVERQP
jgi:hypothetical protein